MLKYGLDSGDAKRGKIKIWNQKGMRNVITIDDKHFTYNPNKITKVLATRLTKLLKHNKIYISKRHTTNICETQIK